MTSPTLARVREFFRRRKPTAKDNIERSEPETFLANAQDFIFGMIITAIWMMIAYAIMTDQATDWFASMLMLIEGTFAERLAILTAVLVLFSDLLVIIGIAILREPSNGDVVDVVNDLGEQVEERLAEFEDRTAEELTNIRKEITDGIPQ